MDSLANLWEKDAWVRVQGRDNGQLTIWNDAKCQGIASQKACALNAKILEHTATWWVSQAELPCAIPINLLRVEVGYPLF